MLSSAQGVWAKLVNAVIKPMAVVAALVAATAVNAGFSVAVKPLPAKKVIVIEKPAEAGAAQPPAAAASAPVRAASAPAAVPTPMPAPGAATISGTAGTGKFRLVVERGASLESSARAYAAQFGWDVAWSAERIVAGDTMTFNGTDHEESLAAFLRHYKLAGDKYPNDKGYLIYRQPEK